MVLFGFIVNLITKCFNCLIIGWWHKREKWLKLNYEFIRLKAFNSSYRTKLYIDGRWWKIDQPSETV